jgi:hypothetical protein
VSATKFVGYVAGRRYEHRRDQADDYFLQSVLDGARHRFGDKALSLRLARIESQLLEPDYFGRSRRLRSAAERSACLAVEQRLMFVGVALDDEAQVDPATLPENVELMQGIDAQIAEADAKHERQRTLSPTQCRESRSAL